MNSFIFVIVYVLGNLNYLFHMTQFNVSIYKYLQTLNKEKKTFRISKILDRPNFTGKYLHNNYTILALLLCHAIADSRWKSFKFSILFLFCDILFINPVNSLHWNFSSTSFLHFHNKITLTQITTVVVNNKSKRQGSSSCLADKSRLV